MNICYAKRSTLLDLPYALSASSAETTSRTSEMISCLLVKHECMNGPSLVGLSCPDVLGGVAC